MMDLDTALDEFRSIHTSARRQVDEMESDMELLDAHGEWLDDTKPLFDNLDQMLKMYEDLHDRCEEFRTRYLFYGPKII